MDTDFASAVPQLCDRANGQVALLMVSLIWDVR